MIDIWSDLFSKSIFWTLCEHTTTPIYWQLCIAEIRSLWITSESQVHNAYRYVDIFAES